MNSIFDSLEKSIGSPLPRALVSAVESESIPHENLMFETEDKKVAGWIVDFLVTKSAMQEAENCETEYREFASSGWIPRNLLPVAVVANGDRILISVEGTDAGNVYYWAWSEEPEPPTNSYKYMRRIASGFDSFLAGLKTA
ncbi:hypothetical protein M2165_000290 [Variovorax sp. TBS-050B]|uniref:SMI1/KNR4 family protein n=1 Tax=Variovorax sp. TBS-050B TaxID=2940551 RepID=UPI002474817C|nr:SMI1/KNR4 family protein [Variovorax sp. TBS-050B]MDH6590401.1 hypothetical protein [Variovorax sp. TBS-050B]